VSKNVKIYTTPTCPYCINAKKYLTDHKVQFENIDVSADTAKAQEMVDKSGQMSVPVLEVDSEVIVGFDKEKIDKALGL